MFLKWISNALYWDSEQTFGELARAGNLHMFSIYESILNSQVNSRIQEMLRHTEKLLSGEKSVCFPNTLSLV